MALRVFFRHRVRPRIALAAGVGLGGLAGMWWVGAGCESAGERPRLSMNSDEARQVFRRPRAQWSVSGGSLERPGDQGGAESWSIVLESFTGESAPDEAAQMLSRIRTEGGLPGATLREGGGTVSIVYGAYDGPDDPRARDDLERIRAMSIGGVQPYASAALLPPAVSGTIPEFDLRNARRLAGDWALYTLQVGVYSVEGRQATPREMAGIRKAAEQAAAKLRAEGEQAFYYHGPNRSMVTVGLFGEDDMDPQSPGVESPALRELRRRHPNNLVNGAGLRERRTGTRSTGERVRIEGLQPSFLVRIPE